MNDRVKSFWLGLFVTGALVGALWFLLFLRPSVGDGQRVLRVRFANIEKVTVGTRVTFAGRPVGEVEEIRQISDARALAPDREGDPYFFELTLRVDSSVRIFSYDLITLSTVGLLGEKTVAIVPKEPRAGQPPAKEITDQLLFATTDGDQLEDALRQMGKLTHQLTRTLDELSDFFAQNNQQIHQTFVSLQGASDEARALLHSANETHFIQRAVGAMEELEKTMGLGRRVFDEILESRVIAKAARGFEDLSRITAQILTGEGSFGRFLFDECLYEETLAAMHSAHLVFEDVHRFGLFFQFNTTWQKERNRRRHLLTHPDTAQQLLFAFCEHLKEMQTTLAALNQLVERAPCVGLRVDMHALEKQLEQMQQDLVDLGCTLNQES